MISPSIDGIGAQTSPPGSSTRLEAAKTASDPIGVFQMLGLAKGWARGSRFAGGGGTAPATKDHT